MRTGTSNPPPARICTVSRREQYPNTAGDIEMLTTARLRGPAPVVSRALKGRLGSWRALRGRDIGASFRTRVGPSRRFSARIGRATGRRRDEPGETRAPRVPCLKRPARLMARPERARYWGVLQDARRAEPALQRTDRTSDRTTTGRTWGDPRPSCPVP